MFRFFSRKLWVVIGCGIVSTTLIWFGKITSGDFAMIVLGTVGAYIAGNVVQKKNESKEN